MKLYEYMKTVQNEQQIQESVEARESLFEAAEAAPYYHAAVKQYKSAIETYPYDERGYIQLAKLKIKKDEFQEAYDILQKGMEFCPDSDETSNFPNKPKANLIMLKKKKKGMT